MSALNKIDTDHLPISIYDNGDKTFDRFSVIYTNEPESKGLFACRAMSEHPFHPQGFGQMCSALPGRHLGKKIVFSELPADCQKLVLSDLKG